MNSLRMSFWMVPESSTGGLFEAADDSCALGVDAIDFLTRTREALA